MSVFNEWDNVSRRETGYFKKMINMLCGVGGAIALLYVIVLVGKHNGWW